MPPSSVSPHEDPEAFGRRVAGRALRQVAADVGLSIEGTRKLLAREAERQVSALHDEQGLALPPLVVESTPNAPRSRRPVSAPKRVPARPHPARPSGLRGMGAVRA